MTENPDNIYDAIAPFYEEYSNKYSTYLQAIEGLVREEIRPGMRILDVGSGDGRRLKKLIQNVPGIECVAVEPSRQMASICKSNIQSQVLITTVEKLDEFEIGNFDLVTSLWNVFGHIGLNNRVNALKIMASKLTPGGKIILDVNNRHNAPAYGYWKVFNRFLLDLISFDFSRGDAEYDWKIGDRIYKGYGHLFTPNEAERYFQNAGLSVQKRRTVNYKTGKISDSRFLGQLYFVLQKR